MKRILLRVAYDGSNYCGWQIQPNHITIESQLNQAISDLTGEQITVIGASRTDSGVHALGNIAVFDSETTIPIDKILFALNQRLPEDIRVMESIEVAADFHPRKLNSIKTYEYRISNNKINVPQERYFSHHVTRELDIEHMKKAANYLCGEHDFTSFSSVKADVESRVRTIYSIEISKKDHIISITIKGNGFLYNMVRIIAGTLIEVGLGAYLPERMNMILSECNRSLAGPTAPAKGLTLVGIQYEL